MRATPTQATLPACSARSSGTHTGPLRCTGKMLDPLIKPADWTATLRLEEFFDLSKRLEVDVGCGKGRFLAARAKAFPEINFLGIDRQLIRIRKSLKKVTRNELTNVRLLRIEAAYAITHLLPPSCVSTYYIFFPDPWPKRRHHRRRLFSREFLDSLHRTMKPLALVHVATDHLEYHEVIHAALAADSRFSERPAFIPCQDQQTDFERIFVSQDAPIGRCSFLRCGSDHP